MSSTSPHPERSSQSPSQVALNTVLAEVEKGARRANRFAAVTLDRVAARLSCAASGADASYELQAEPVRERAGEGRAPVLWLSLVMTDRYLSQSIEQDLVHSGDKLGDLYRDELIDVGYSGGEGGAGGVRGTGGGGAEVAPMLPFEHFRDSRKRFTFRVAVPGAMEELAGIAGPAGSSHSAAGPAGSGLSKLSERILKMLLAMEAMFAPLGGMSGGDED